MNDNITEHIDTHAITFYNTEKISSLRFAINMFKNANIVHLISKHGFEIDCDINIKQIHIDDLWTIENVCQYISDSCNSSDAVILVGLEDFIPDSVDSVEEYIRKVDAMYAQNQNSIQGLYCICRAERGLLELFCNVLEKSPNMSIFHEEEVSDRDINLQSIIRSIRNKNIDEGIAYIKQYESYLTQSECKYLQAIIFCMNSDINTAIKLLEEMDAELTHDQKLLLCELYYMQGGIQHSHNIFNELKIEDYNENSYLIAMKIFNPNSKEYEEYVKQGSEIFPQNEVLNEAYGKILVEQHNYTLAASVFRQLSGVFYELQARVCDLLGANQTDMKVVTSYLYAVVGDNEQLRNEANLLIAKYSINERHYYTAYQYLRLSKLFDDDKTSEEVLKSKIYLLEDTERACKALGKIKPYKRTRDGELLQNKRCVVYLETIRYCSSNDSNYTLWRQFQTCQSKAEWNRELKKFVLSCLESIAMCDIDQLRKVSFINKAHQEMNAGDEKAATIILLRESNFGGVPDEFEISRNQIIEGGAKYLELYGDALTKLWFRYYWAIGAAVKDNNPQNANDFALSILECIPKAEVNKKTRWALFLMAWGNAQYRLGNHIEGIACVIESISMLIEISEIRPVLEDGLNIISRYIGDYIGLYTDIEKKKLAEYIQVLISKNANDSLVAVNAVLDNDVEAALKPLEEDVNSDIPKDQDWLIKLAQLISLELQNKDEEKAVYYIEKYYMEAFPILEERQDIAAKILSQWGNVLVLYDGDFERTLRGIGLLEQSMKIHEKRRDIYHQEDRAALTQEYDRTLRSYLQICGVLYSAKDTAASQKEALLAKLKTYMPFVIPRTLIEVKGYYQNNDVSDALNKMHEELKRLKTEYVNLTAKGNALNESAVKLGGKIEEFTTELRSEHPYYMPLKHYEYLKYEEISKLLLDDEVLYQYIVTDICVLSILITSNWINVRCTPYDSDLTIYEYLRNYSISIENGTVCIEENTNTLSAILAAHLCDYVFYHPTSCVFLVPDVTYSGFPFSAVKYNGEYLIDKVDKIINLIDIKQIHEFRSWDKKYNPILHKVFGKKSDNNINAICKWLEQTQEESEEKRIVDCDDSMEILQDEEYNTAVIWGHGVINADGEIAGAHKIQGATCLIQGRELIENVKGNKLIIISCAGGMPNDQNPDVSTGIWSNIMERYTGEVLMCRWSVPTMSTIKLVEILLKKISHHDIFSSLIMAQRDLKNQGLSVVEWAGVESWIN